MKKNSSVDVCAQYACGNIEGTSIVTALFITRKKVTPMNMTREKALELIRAYARLQKTKKIKSVYEAVNILRFDLPCYDDCPNDRIRCEECRFQQAIDMAIYALLKTGGAGDDDKTNEG